MTKETEKQVSDALALLADANTAMVKAIEQAVNEAGGELSYEDNPAKYDAETRTIKFNEAGELVMFDEYDNELSAIEDLSADDLYDICINLFED